MTVRIGAPEVRQPVQLIDRDGCIEAQTLSPDGHVALYCELVLGGQEGLIELVLGYRDPAGELRMRSRREPANYLEAGNAGALVRAAARARGRGEELFVTPLPRSAAEPGKQAARPGSVVWVDVDGDEVVFNTAIGRAKERHLRRDPRVSLIVVDPEDAYRWLSVTGRAELTTEGADEHIDKLAKKYLDEDRYPWHNPDQQRIIVRIHPEQIDSYGLDG
jgi:PPOX class probable F420-dependent enzyme